MSEPDCAFTPPARFLLVAGAFVVVVAGLKAASDLITPFLLAIFLAVLVQPPLNYLRERAFPGWASMLIVVALLVALGGGLIGLLTSSLNDFNTNLPEYQQRLRQMSSDLALWLDGVGIQISRETMNSLINPARTLGFAGDLVRGLGGVLTNAVLILLTVVFLLFEGRSLPAKLRAILPAPEVSLKSLHQMMQTINHYTLIKVNTSLLTGLLIWFWLSWLGLDFAAMWAVLAFLLNFVPTIGSVIAAVPAVLIALVKLNLQAAVLAAIGYLVVNFLVGNLIEPRVMGRGLGLSTLVVFVSLIFWGYVLGLVGMFLSVPLTMALKIAFSTNPQTQYLAILLGPGVEQSTVMLGEDQ